MPVEQIEQVFENDHPKVLISVSVLPDGRTIRFILPHEFIGATASIAGDNNGRHRIVVDPTWGGTDIVGFVDSAGVKQAKFEILGAAFDVHGLVPGKWAKYWGKSRGFDILLGHTIKFLTEIEPHKQNLPRVQAVSTPEREVPSFIMKPSVQPEPKPALTIEDAIEFVNRWAQDNNAKLGVEENTIFAEVRRMIGRKNA